MTSFLFILLSSSSSSSSLPITFCYYLKSQKSELSYSREYQVLCFQVPSISSKTGIQDSWRGMEAARSVWFVSPFEILEDFQRWLGNIGEKCVRGRQTSWDTLAKFPYNYQQPGISIWLSPVWACIHIEMSSFISTWSFIPFCLVVSRSLYSSCLISGFHLPILRQCIHGLCSTDSFFPGGNIYRMFCLLSHFHSLLSFI